MTDALQQTGPAPKPYDRLTIGLLGALIIGIPLTQKIAVPAGSAQIYFGLFLIIGIAAIGFMTRRIVFKRNRAIVYLLMVAAAILSQLLTPEDFSPLSLMNLIIVAFPYTMGLRPGLVPKGTELKLFRTVILVLAVAGVAQFMLQFVVGWENAFFLDTKFPKQFIIQNFNGLNSYHSNIYKSNGFFLNEPSTFSQFLALGIIVEMLYFKSWKRMALYIIAYATTFSGTGLIMLGLLTPTYMLRQRQFLPLAFLVVVGLSSPVWAPIVGMEKMLARSTEITNPHTSGFARFVSPFLMLRDFTFRNEDTAFFGMGAGNIRFAKAKVSYETFDPTWVKILYEYGIIGGLGYFIFIGVMLTRSRMSAFVKAALAIQCLFLNEYALAPILNAIIMGLLVWPTDDAAQPESLTKGTRA